MKRKMLIAVGGLLAVSAFAIWLNQPFCQTEISQGHVLDGTFTLGDGRKCFFLFCGVDSLDFNAVRMCDYHNMELQSLDLELVEVEQ